MYSGWQAYVDLQHGNECRTIWKDQVETFNIAEVKPS